MKSIVVEHVTKTYSSIIREKKEASFRELLVDQAKSIFKPSRNVTTFDALHDISFEVEQGEVLGIIGKNGSGKSTLLKILSKITAPTSGEIMIKGRVASLLEVGTGFHGELSGRENIYLSGIILGMKRWEINQHFDEIVSFSGVEQFLDIPVKQYSSGMQLRLAFSIAAYLRSDVLLMDEVLAVGDYEFEKKCLESVSDLSKSGRTIVFVSHNLLSVRRLCSQVMVLKKGKQVFIGDPVRAVTTYLGVEKNTTASLFWGEDGLNLNNLIVLYSLGVVNDRGVLEKEFYLGEPVLVQLMCKPLNGLKRVLLKLFFYDDAEILLFSGSYTLLLTEGFMHDKVSIVTCTIPKNIFQEGKIRVGLHLFNLGEEGQCINGTQATLFFENEIIYFDMREKEQDLLKIDSENFWQNEKGKIKPYLEWHTGSVAQKKRSVL